MQSVKGYKTAFIVELIALFLALVFVTVTVTRVFVMCRSRSIEAAVLNESVILAAAAAELASASPDMDTLQDNMASADIASGHTSTYASGDNDASGAVWILAGSGSERRYVVRVTRSAEDGSSYSDDVIDVFEAGGADDIGNVNGPALKDPVYTLRTGSRHGKEAGA